MMFKVLAILLLYPLIPSADKVDYSRHQLWRVSAKTQDAKRSFQSLAHTLESESNLNLDFWGIGDDEADMMVAVDQAEQIQKTLASKGLGYEVKVESVGQLLDREEEGIKLGNRALKGFDLQQYHTHEEINQYLQDLADKHEFVTLENIGKSHEGRDMLVAKICLDGCGTKKIMWIHSGIHAREWIGPAANLHMLSKLVEKAEMGKDNDLFRVDWYILPVLSPDGYVYSWETDRMWRKTRHAAVANEHDCVGVDPNRNFDANWGAPGASDDPCSGVYRGEKAFSEVELQHLRDFLKREMGGKERKVVYYMGIHAYSQLIMYPFGGSELQARDANDLQAVADRAYKSLKSVRGSEYRVGPIYSTIYPASGNSVDWAYSGAGIKYSYTIELPPRSKDNSGFILPASQIAVVGKELLAFHESVARDMVSEFVNNSNDN